MRKHWHHFTGSNLLKQPLTSIYDQEIELKPTYQK